MQKARRSASIRRRRDRRGRGNQQRCSEERGWGGEGEREGCTKLKEARARSRRERSLILATNMDSLDRAIPGYICPSYSPYFLSGLSTSSRRSFSPAFISLLPPAALTLLGLSDDTDDPH